MNHEQPEVDIPTPIERIHKILELAGAIKNTAEGLGVAGKLEILVRYVEEHPMTEPGMVVAGLMNTIDSITKQITPDLDSIERKRLMDELEKETNIAWNFFQRNTTIPERQILERGD